MDENSSSREQLSTKAVTAALGVEPNESYEKGYVKKLSTGKSTPVDIIRFIFIRIHNDFSRGTTTVNNFSRLGAICCVLRPGGTAMVTISVIPKRSMNDLSS